MIDDRYGNDRYSEDWQMEAVLKDTLVGRDYTYAEGFRDAAETLADQAARLGIDTLVYPIIFNYRQYFELTLKRLRIQCAAYESVIRDRPPDKTTHLKTHSLSKLWADVRPHLIEHLGTSEGFEAADEAIAYLDRLDPSSEMARYWETTKGGELHDLDRFNVGTFMNACDRAAAVLGGSEAMLHEHLDNHREMMSSYLAEMRQDMQDY